MNFTGAPCSGLVSTDQWHQWHQLLHRGSKTHPGLPIQGQGWNTIWGQWPHPASVLGQTKRWVKATYNTNFSREFFLDIPVHNWYWSSYAARVLPYYDSSNGRWYNDENAPVVKFSACRVDSKGDFWHSCCDHLVE